MFKEILLPVDLGHDSSWKKALPLALEQCRQCGARLHVLTVVPDYGMSMVGQFFPAGYEEKVIKQISQQLHAFVKEHVPEDVPVQHCIGQGTPYESILDFAERLKADLIIMAAHRPELRDYLLGPNAARVVRHATCSVLVVRD